MHDVKIAGAAHLRSHHFIPAGGTSEVQRVLQLFRESSHTGVGSDQSAQLICSLYRHWPITAQLILISYLAQVHLKRQITCFNNKITDVSPSSCVGRRLSWDFFPVGREGRAGGGGLGGGATPGGGGLVGGVFLVLATISGSTVICLGGFDGPEESDSNLSPSGTWSKMSAVLGVSADWAGPRARVISGGGEIPSWDAWAPSAATSCVSCNITSCPTSHSAGARGKSGATGGSGSEGVELFSSLLSRSSSTPPPFWLSSIILSMIWRQRNRRINADLRRTLFPTYGKKSLREKTRVLTDPNCLFVALNRTDIVQLVTYIANNMFRTLLHYYNINNEFIIIMICPYLITQTSNTCIPSII